jgi:hypothetical protein
MSTRGWLHCLQRLDGIRATPVSLKASGVPNAGAKTGRPATGPCPPTLKPTEPPCPLSNARTSDRIHPDLSSSGNTSGQLNRVSSETSTSRKNSAMTYSKTNWDSSAMSAGRHGYHVPGPIERGRNCRRSESDDCESGRESERTICNHGMSLFGGQSFISEAPATGAHRGFGFLRGEPVMGRETHH